MRLLAGCDCGYTCRAPAAVLGATRQGQGAKLEVVAPCAKESWASIDCLGWNSGLCSLMARCWTRITSTVTDSHKVLGLRSIVRPAGSENE